MACQICDCCESYVGIGCFAPCGNLTLPTLAPASGDYTLKVSYLGNVVQVLAAQTIGEAMVFPLEGFNENYFFKGKVYNSSGVAIVIEGTTTCLAFSTTQTFNII